MTLWVVEFRKKGSGDNDWIPQATASSSNEETIQKLAAAYGAYDQYGEYRAAKYKREDPQP